MYCTKPANCVCVRLCVFVRVWVPRRPLLLPMLQLPAATAANVAAIAVVDIVAIDSVAAAAAAVVAASIVYVCAS